MQAEAFSAAAPIRVSAAGMVAASVARLISQGAEIGRPLLILLPLVALRQRGHSAGKKAAKVTSAQK